MQFCEIPGQNEIKKLLIKSALDGRVSHGQLFLGPEGSLKLPVAIAYAQFISCKNHIDGKNGLPVDSCGVCPSCLKFQKLIHPDLHFVFPVIKKKNEKEKPISDYYINEWRTLLLEKKGVINLAEWNQVMEVKNQQPIINVEECNKIIHKLSYKSYESEYKFLIIWMAEKIYPTAAPKILKILEEPPEKTLFILVAEDQDQILNTILSRTQILKFKGLKPDDIAEWLKNSSETDQEKITRASHFANGNLINAFKLLDESEETKQDFITFRQWFRYCFDSLPVMSELVDYSEKIAGLGREKQKKFLNFGLNVIREAFFYHYTEEKIAYQNEESKFIVKLSPYVHSGNISGYEKAINDAIQHIGRNINSKILFLDLTLIIVKLIKKKEEV